MGLFDAELEGCFSAVFFGVIGLLLISAAFGSGLYIVGAILVVLTAFILYLCLARF